MKTLNINLTVKAINHDTAENFSVNMLKELTRIIGMRSGSSIASCTGHTNCVDIGSYEVIATVQIDGTNNVTEIIKEAQRNWNAKSQHCKQCNLCGRRTEARTRAEGKEV